MSTPAFALLKTDSDFASAVASGLNRSGQKELPAKYLYDDLGSALFDAITLLPEYGLTRADSRILQTHAVDIANRLATPVLVAELGSGSGQKTSYLIEALRRRQRSIRYCPIDISSAALARCLRELESFAEVHPLQDQFIGGVCRAADLRKASERLLVLFLGSTIGNFERPAAVAFLRDLAANLSAGDFLLIGADLVKPEAQLLAAYDDPTGVTAAFNRNLLTRINRELGGNFKVRCFQHEVRYDSTEHRIEMHLRSLARQTVTIREAKCTVEFGAGETIWTESSYKYQVQELQVMAAESGFRIAAQWTDQEWPFVESLWIVE